MTEMEMKKVAIGTVIRSNRQAIKKNGRKLSIHHLANEASISKDCLERIERGKCLPGSWTLKKIIIALHMSHDAFWAEVDQIKINGPLK
ncbi:helix-turn-helix domain-containing protein [Aquibacillus sediminis]|uniref:helix-turn-helix domain-containing protein n=1 Tax=Aquibacillus sediminis TaxID=2574734 RepID=UPI0011084DFE|nr:helix-turn-helix transcriptional regulator [Aquibacillus sediminis]